MREKRPLGGGRDHQALDVEPAPGEHQGDPHQDARLVVHEERDRVDAVRFRRDGRGTHTRSPQVLPVGLASFVFGGSMIISDTAAPAGIMGKTLSSFTTSATTTQGPSS